MSTDRAKATLARMLLMRRFEEMVITLARAHKLGRQHLAIGNEALGAAALMQLMAGSKQAHACFAKKLAGYALQRDVVRAEMVTDFDLPVLPVATDAGAFKADVESATDSQVVVLQPGETHST